MLHFSGCAQLGPVSADPDTRRLSLSPTSLYQNIKKFIFYTISPVILLLFFFLQYCDDHMLLHCSVGSDALAAFDLLSRLQRPGERSPLHGHPQRSHLHLGALRRGHLAQSLQTKIYTGGPESKIPFFFHLVIEQNIPSTLEVFVD